jgi:hypothetical protein
MQLGTFTASLNNNSMSCDEGSSPPFLSLPLSLSLSLETVKKTKNCVTLEKHHTEKKSVSQANQKHLRVSISSEWKRSQMKSE